MWEGCGRDEGGVRGAKVKKMKKVLPVKKMLVTLHSPKMGILCIVYPFNVQFFRLISMEANYPSAAKMRCNRRRNEQFETKNIIVSKIKK